MIQRRMAAPNVLPQRVPRIDKEAEELRVQRGVPLSPGHHGHPVPPFSGPASQGMCRSPRPLPRGTACMRLALLMPARLQQPPTRRRRAGRPSVPPPQHASGARELQRPAPPRLLRHVPARRNVTARVPESAPACAAHTPCMQHQRTRPPGIVRPWPQCLRRRMFPPRLRAERRTRMGAAESAQSAHCAVHRWRPPQDQAGIHLVR